MPNEIPKNTKEYEKWLRRMAGVRTLRRHKTQYETVRTKLRDDFQTSEFWTSLGKALPAIRGDYQARTGYALLSGEESLPTIDRKSWDSFLLKTLRRNIFENESFPNEPQDGWILPDNWFSRIHDVIRTLFVVKYLDGVDYLSDRIRDLAENSGCTCEVDFEAREEGYYAAHVSITGVFEIPDLQWRNEKTEITTEIQISTQVQDVIRRLLHTHYESRRIRTSSEQIMWQWDYKSDEFVTNYLGHILHYVEGMIMDIRGRSDGK